MQPRQRDMSPARDAYCREDDAEIVQGEAKLASIHTESDKWTADAMLASRFQIEKVDRAMSAARAKLERVTGVTDEEWEELETAVDSTWEDVKARLQGACDATADHGKN